MSDDLLTRQPSTLIRRQSSPNILEDQSRLGGAQGSGCSSPPRVVAGPLVGLLRKTSPGDGTNVFAPAGLKPMSPVASTEVPSSNSLARQRAIELCAAGPVKTPADADQRLRSLSSPLRTISDCNELVDQLECLTETDDQYADVMDQGAYLQWADSILRFANGLRARFSIEQDLRAGVGVEDSIRRAVMQNAPTRPDDASELLEYANAVAADGGTHASEQTLYEAQLAIEESIRDANGAREATRFVGREPKLPHAGHLNELHQHTAERGSAERPGISPPRVRHAMASFRDARRAGSSVAHAVGMALPLWHRPKR